jgi:hypothetical protein
VFYFIVTTRMESKYIIHILLLRKWKVRKRAHRASEQYHQDCKRKRSDLTNPHWHMRKVNAGHWSISKFTFVYFLNIINIFEYASIFCREMDISMSNNMTYLLNHMLNTSANVLFTKYFNEQPIMKLLQLFWNNL